MAPPKTGNAFVDILRVPAHEHLDFENYCSPSQLLDFSIAIPPLLTGPMLSPPRQNPKIELVLVGPARRPAHKSH